MPRKQWRCFHCDVVLTTEKAAREHFGSPFVYDTPACQLPTGEGLIKYIRDLEERLSEFQREAHAVNLHAYMVYGKAQTLAIKAEEDGYNKGVLETLTMVRDMGFEPYPEKEVENA